MPVLSKAEEGGKMQLEEYLTYFEDCIFLPDKGFGQKRAFIDSLKAGGKSFPYGFFRGEDK